MDEAKDDLAKAQRRIKKQIAKAHRALEFQVGDLVMLKLSPKLWKNRHRGLIPTYDRQFKAMTRVGQMAYRLELP